MGLDAGLQGLFGSFSELMNSTDSATNHETLGRRQQQASRPGVELRNGSLNQSLATLSGCERSNKTTDSLGFWSLGVVAWVFGLACLGTNPVEVNADCARHYVMDRLHHPWLYEGAASSSADLLAQHRVARVNLQGQSRWQRSSALDSQVNTQSSVTQTTALSLTTGVKPPLAACRGPNCQPTSPTEHHWFEWNYSPSDDNRTPPVPLVTGPTFDVVPKSGELTLFDAILPGSPCRAIVRPPC